MEMQDILQFISDTPVDKREKTLDYLGEQISDMRAYHVTSKSNALEIKSNGFKANESQQSYDRPAAVYFFLERAEITQSVKEIILDDPSDAEVIEVLIPRTDFLEKSHWDGLFNVSFGMTRSAIQYTDSIPSSWIQGKE